MFLIILLVVKIILVFFFKIILSMFGFGAGGIIAGSIAAWIQSLIGNVGAGSIFAFLQAFGGLWWSWFYKLLSLTSMIMKIYLLSWFSGNRLNFKPLCQAFWMIPWHSYTLFDCSVFLKCSWNSWNLYSKGLAIQHS